MCSKYGETKGTIDQNRTDLSAIMKHRPVNNIDYRLQDIDYNWSAWRQKGLTGYCFKYTDRPFCLWIDD